MEHHLLWLAVALQGTCSRLPLDPDVQQAGLGRSVR